MGQQFGVGQPSIYCYEADEGTPPLELLLKYAEYFDVSLDYIFGRTDDPHGYYCTNHPKFGMNDPEMQRFVEMCFEPGSAMNERLKETKVIRGMTDNALKCKFNGGTLPIGYVIDSEEHFQIDPLTAPFILDAFKRYDEGATMMEIRDWLNQNGMKNTRGQAMTYNSVQHLLNNRRYIGKLRYRETVIPDGIPAIVPKDLFDRVQEKLAKNKKAPARHKAEDDYLLATKLFCGCCGAYLCGESGTSRTGRM